MFKILLTVAVVVAAWYLFKARKRITKNNVGKVGRALDAARQAMADSAKARQVDEKPSEAPQPTAKPMDLRPCPKCGAYVAEGMTCSCTTG